MQMVWPKLLIPFRSDHILDCSDISSSFFNLIINHSANLTALYIYIYIHNKVEESSPCGCLCSMALGCSFSLCSACLHLALSHFCRFDAAQLVYVSLVCVCPVCNCLTDVKPSDRSGSDLSDTNNAIRLTRGQSGRLALLSGCWWPR